MEQLGKLFQLYSFLYYSAIGCWDYSELILRNICLTAYSYISIGY